MSARALLLAVKAFDIAKWGKMFTVFNSANAVANLGVNAAGSAAFGWKFNPGSDVFGSGNAMNGWNIAAKGGSTADGVIGLALNPVGWLAFGPKVNYSELPAGTITFSDPSVG